METTTNREVKMTKQSYNLGTTINDETVTVTEIRRERWEVALDSRRIGRLDCLEGALTTAARLTPEHRRTNELPLISFRPAGR